MKIALLSLLMFVGFPSVACAQESAASGARFTEQGGIDTSSHEPFLGVDTITVYGQRHRDGNPYAATGGPERVEDPAFGPATVTYRRRLLGPFMTSMVGTAPSSETYHGPVFNHDDKIGLPAVFPTPLSGHIFGEQ